MKKSRVCLCLFVVVFLLLSASTNVFAQGGGLSVSQTKIVFEADKEQNASTPVTLTNNSEDELVIDIRKADFLIADDGAFIIKDAGTQPNSANGLISCEERQFNMKPGEKASIDVVFKSGSKYILPEYSSTILVRFITKKALEETASIKTYTQVAVTIRVLAGTSYKNNIVLSKAPLLNSGVTGGRIISYGADKNLSIALKNTGLLTIDPIVSATVGSFFSREIVKLPEIG